MPNVVTGDKIFRPIGDDAPTAVPATDFFTVQGIVHAADHRQFFLCTYTS